MQILTLVGGCYAEWMISNLWWSKVHRHYGSCVVVVKGKTEKTSTQRMILSSLMILFYARSQKVNTYQTMIGVLLSSSYLGRFGLEATGICCSYSHLLNIQRSVAQQNKEAVWALAKSGGLKIGLDGWGWIWSGHLMI